MTGINPDAVLARELRLTDREREESEKRRRAQRRLERERRIAEIRAEHDRLMSEPLISRDLLSDEERAAIHANVKGRQRWFGIDA